MRVTFRDQRGNGRVLLQALLQAGHELVSTGGDVLLVDHDSSDHMRAICDQHAKVLVHPHGAGYVGFQNPTGYWHMHEHTRGMFVHGPGQAEVLRRLGYPRPTGVIGWSFGERKRFRSTARPLKILLAPQHAMSNDGWVDPVLPAANLRIYQLLRALPIRLTIRFVGSWKPLGLPHESAVALQHGADGGSPISAAEAIDRADCVIGGAWTFPCVALARGCPALMYGQHGFVARITTDPPWPLEPSLERYPLDAGDARTPDELWTLITKACASDADIAAWRADFIGPAFDPGQFVSLVERAVRDW